MTKNLAGTHTVEYPFHLNRKGVVLFAATWLNLKDIMLSGMLSQAQKDR